MNLFSRRDFFRRSALYGGALWFGLGPPRAAAVKEEPAAGPALADDERAVIEAITERILPGSEDDPGAIEAGCVAFIEQALANHDRHLRSLYADGIRGLHAACTARFERGFLRLDPGERDEMLRALESDQPEFFETVRLHTLYGFLSDPKYGGNRDYAGWRVVGYPGPRHHRGGYDPGQLAGEEPIPTVWGGIVAPAKRRP